MRLATLVLAFVSACGQAHAPTPTTPHHEVASDARPALRETLAAHRATQIERLIAYRDAGAYTTDAMNFPIGVFRDHANRMCAMASLIASSGRTDLVDRVARDNNTLKLADVHDGPLMDWMLDSGLTQEEIAMVQGALDLETRFPGVENSTSQTATVRPMRRGSVVAAARAEVAARLTIAIGKLATATDQSLDVAVKRTPASATAQRAMTAARN